MRWRWSVTLRPGSLRVEKEFCTCEPAVIPGASESCASSIAFAQVYAKFMAKPLEKRRRTDRVKALYVLEASLSKTLTAPRLGIGRCTSLMHGTKNAGQLTDG